MTGTRIHELAKELGAPNKILIEIAVEMGYPVKSHSSSIDNALADRIRRQVEKMDLPKKKTRAKAKAKPKSDAESASQAKTKAKPKAKAKAKPKAKAKAKAQTKTKSSAKLEAGPKPTELATELEEPAQGELDSALIGGGAPEPPTPVEAPPAPDDAASSSSAPMEAEERAEPARDESPSDAKKATQTPAPPKTSLDEIARASTLKAREKARRIESSVTITPRLGLGGAGAIKGKSDPEWEARRAQLESDRIAAAIKRKKVELDEIKRREKERDLKRQRKVDLEKRSKEAAARRLENEKLKKKRKEESAVARKAREEEAELERLIAEEERIKRARAARKITIDREITVKDFAAKLNLGLNEIIKKLIEKGIMATLNQTLEVELARSLVVEMGYELVRSESEMGASSEEAPSEEAPSKEEPSAPVETRADLRPRAPVVTIMGHVDHGKTSLLDTIRKSKLAESEAGGITQSIGAYAIESSKGSITFIDTPGHEAFTAMRSRGAAVTDVVILVVAADDGVMPQTIEAINHAKAAAAPVVVAINKIDRPDADPEKVKIELARHDLAPEDWGGSTIFCEVSAKTGQGIDELLEMVSLQAELLELKADHSAPASGTIIESRLDKLRGALATVLVSQGRLRVGDSFVSGAFAGKVRALIDDKGERVMEAGPSTPVEALGFSGAPTAGESFRVVQSDRIASDLAAQARDKIRERELSAKRAGRLERLSARAMSPTSATEDLYIIVKADTQGSIEALAKAFNDIDALSARIHIAHTGVGAITETDVALATTMEALVIGFNVRPTEQASASAEAESVDIRIYSVIYHAIDDIKAAIEGMLAPELKEKVTGRAEVREMFHNSKVGTVAGCMILSGKLVRGSKARLIRDNVIVHTGALGSLRRFKDDVREVAAGYECGLTLENYSDFKPSDVIETFQIEEIERKLS